MRVALWFVATAALAGDAIARQRTEQEIVEVIVRDGPRAQAIRAASDVVTSTHSARWAFPNPSASYSREGAGFTEFYQVEQAFPAFGLRSALERVGVATREAAEAERDAALWQLRSEAREAIARLGAATERLESLRAVVGSIDTLIAVLVTREREGEGSRFDRLRAQQDLVEAQQQVVDATIEEAEARGALAGMLPPAIVLPSRLPASRSGSVPDSVDALITRALAARAELRALNAAIRRFGLEAEAARSATGWAPTLSGSLKRAEEAADTRAGAAIGLNLAVPVFNRGSREAARWIAEKSRAEFERLVTEVSIRAQVTRAFDAARHRRAALPALTAAATESDELITIADVAYREGDVGILQLMDAYRTAARAQGRAIDATLNLALSEIALERAVGVSLWP
jgi:cobalt-zinc-cadmium efflux system outer membrane protein